MDGKGRVVVTLGLVLVVCSFPPTAVAGPVRCWGRDAELSVSRVSDHTVQVDLAPLDDQGQPRPGPASTALVALKPEVRLRLRELAKAEKVTVGKLSVTVKDGPLTVVVQRPSGQLVQELVFPADDGPLTFRTAAPVLGLGEGDRQFDRAGGQYRLVNGQVAPWLATHGGTIRVPFLIGTDGWALFVHGPPGEFDLRDGGGRFLPAKAAKGKEPVELFVIDV